MSAAEEKDFEQLPVEQYKDYVLEIIRKNQIVVCIGETGIRWQTYSEHQLKKYLDC